MASHFPFQVGQAFGFLSLLIFQGFFYVFLDVNFLVLKTSKPSAAKHQKFHGFFGNLRRFPKRM